MECYEAIRIHVVGNIASAGLGTIRTDPVPVDEWWCICRTEYEGNKTTSSGNTRARIYIGGHGPKFYIKEKDAPAANTLYQVVNEFDLAPGEWVALEWDEAQADTDLNMYIIGRRYKR